MRRIIGAHASIATYDTHLHEDFAGGGGGGGGDGRLYFFVTITSVHNYNNSTIHFMHLVFYQYPFMLASSCSLIFQ